MITRFNHKNNIDIYELTKRVKDFYEDFYFTKNKQRIFIKELKDIERISKYQEIYGVEEKELKAVVIIYREKGYRTYLKILSEKTDYLYDIFKFIAWNFEKTELFIKTKKNNPIAKVAQRFFFNFLGSRGEEILLIKPKREKKDANNYKQNQRFNTRQP